MKVKKKNIYVCMYVDEEKGKQKEEGKRKEKENEDV
jgi:hypothetical protein